MDEMKYNGFRLGKATEIIAEIMRIIIQILMVLLCFCIGFYGGLLGILIFGVFGGWFCHWLLKKLFNPIISLHKNTILFTTHEIKKDYFIEKRSNSLAASMLFSVLFFLPTLSISLWIMIPQYVFLVKTKPLLLQEDEPVNQANITASDFEKEINTKDNQQIKQSSTNQDSEIIIL